MNALVNERRLEDRLAKLLWVGTLTGCSAIAVGMCLMLTSHRQDGAHWASTLMNAGTLLLIVLPIVRVAVMLWMFLRERAYRFAGAAAAVLLTIALSVAVGLWTRH